MKNNYFNICAKYYIEKEEQGLIDIRKEIEKLKSKNKFTILLKILNLYM